MFEDLNNEQLMELRRNVEQEIVSRKIAKKASIPKGAYVVGEDIPVGTYSVTKGRDDDWNDTFKVYSNSTKKNIVYRYGMPDGAVLGKVILEKGMVVEFDEPFILTIYSGTVAVFE